MSRDHHATFVKVEVQFEITAIFKNVNVWKIVRNGSKARRRFKLV